MTTVLISGKFAICEASRTASDDQDVGVLGETSGPLRDGRMRVLHERVPGLVTVEIELHRSFSSGRCAQVPPVRRPRMSPTAPARSAPDEHTDQRITAQGAGDLGGDRSDTAG